MQPRNEFVRLLERNNVGYAMQHPPTPSIKEVSKDNGGTGKYYVLSSGTESGKQQSEVCKVWNRGVPAESRPTLHIKEVPINTTCTPRLCTQPYHQHFLYDTITRPRQLQGEMFILRCNSAT